MSAPERLRRILLVEDEQAHANLVMHSLRGHSIPVAVDHVANGQLAIDYLFGRGRHAGPDQPPPPDLILLDLRLPKVDGLDVLGQLKEAPSLRSIPVVILSTSKSPDHFAEACARHANSYVVKPTDFEAFRKLMCELVTYWLATHGLATTFPRSR
jgi:two-component system, response regulator